MNDFMGGGYSRKRSLLGGAVAVFLLAGSPALAETCTVNTAVPLPPGANFFTNVGGFPAAVTANILAATTTAQTAFLLQSTAFVSTPGNPTPDQQGSGVWVRAVGGTVELNAPSQTSANATLFPTGTFVGNASINCDTRVRQDFVGVQFGHDIARLNLGGWNFSFGTTAGYIEGRSSTIGGNFLGGPFDSTVQTPFVGTYVALSKGGFFFDALLRGEWFQASYNSPSLNINNQAHSSRGISIAASAGYNYSVPGTRHFIEPSVGVVHSRTSLNDISGQDPLFGVQGTLKFNDIHSTIGRAGLRVGTTFESSGWVLSPFAAASVWHEFGSAPTATFVTCGMCVQSVGVPGLPDGTQLTLSGNYTGTTIGTYGQYSLGMSGQIINTGWVAFARGDYRKGSNLESWSGTGGVRYHFTPEARVALVGKSPVYKAPAAVVAVNWTGGYVGVQAGAAYGWSKMDFPDAGVVADQRPAGFIGGGQAGYNWQVSPNWVVGIEGEWLWTNLKGSSECRPLGIALNGIANTPLWNTTCESAADWIATLSGRLGYISGRALWYGKAGVAYAHQTVSATCNINNVLAAIGIGVGQQCANPLGVLTTGLSASDDRFGFLVGYGVEFALTNKWTARAETDYIGFGTHRYTANDGSVVDGKLSVIKTTIGVNYKLN